MSWSAEVEKLWQLHPDQASLRRSLAIKEAPGWTAIGDNVGVASVFLDMMYQ